MFRNRIYYAIKPLIPFGLRLFIRRRLAWRKMQQVRDTWPILPSSAQPPRGWPGWPQGKKFALVLTHDVESAEGVKKCLPLMRLEQELGFRSSFNLIPEGSYKIPAELPTELARQGFEVGVHDLKHDGKLYQSRKQFAQHAARINHYLREWNAVGFRSGFMLHNLDWLHDLNIRYDASTFDTDPFEPQPEGRHTIFPFWVSSGNTGYAELPYTLPQDSTLFLLLGESQPMTWIHKLDWLAQHGGMALLNVHPDYMSFDDTPSARTYPADHYVQLLKHAQARYAGLFWQPLPREMAEFVAQTKPIPAEVSP